MGSRDLTSSTIVKQMRIIHQNGYSDEELALYRVIVHKNLLDSTVSIINAAALLGFTVTEQEACDMVSRYTLQSEDPNSVMSPEIFDAIDKVWNMSIMPALMEKRPEFYLMDSAE